MTRILSIIALLLLATPFFGVATTTTLDYRNGGTAFVNVPTNATTNATENIVIVTVTPGHPVTVEFSDTAAWYYRTTIGVSTNDKPIATSTPIRLRFTQTSTFYQLRQSADGVLNCLPLLVE